MLYRATRYESKLQSYEKKTVHRYCDAIFLSTQPLIHKIFDKKIKKTLHIKKCSYLCTPKTEVKTIEKSLQASDFQGEMPEWSIGAVSKTVDQLAGPRVRIPVSPQKKATQEGCFFCFVLYLVVGWGSSALN